MEKVTREVIQEVLDILQETKSFVISEAPELAQEMLALGWVRGWVVAGTIIDYML